MVVFDRRHFGYSWYTCVGTSVPFSLVLHLSCWDFVVLLAINTADQRQVHHLLERGKHWLWEQLRSENKTIQQIPRRVGDFHREVRDLPINDLFLVMKSRLRGEFLAREPSSDTPETAAPAPSEKPEQPRSPSPETTGLNMLH